MQSPRPAVQHAVVVGASAGIGRAVVDKLAERGSLVSSVGRSPCSRTGVRHWPATDLASLAWFDLLSQAERDAAAPIDALVYVAGAAVFGLATAVPADRGRAVFDANYEAPTRAALAAARLWQAPRRGVFVYVSSISARRAVPFEAHYCASKAAASRFLECLSLEYPDGRLRFVSVYPGRLRTGFRGKAEWFGIAPPSDGWEGGDPSSVADAVVRIVEGRRSPGVLGTREKLIDLADRVTPTLYDRLVLRRRARRRLGGD